MDKILQTARKEFAAFFATPVAYLFLGAFLAVSLFVFFWVETFFARNIADARPLFEWMPVLLIFLVAALTMRAWSEERRGGTLEVLLTLPVPPWKLVAGKFLADLGLVAVALALTLPLPVTVDILGPLDWGPVFGGYLAALFLAAAYLAIGLFVSARTDNQIVALIGTVLVCGLFYLIGSDALAALFGNRAGEILGLIGTGSRFESITRGVIDLRDLYYYLSLAGVFLALNVFTLERLRWADSAERRPGHLQWRWVVGLLAANLIAGNLWLQQVDSARADITQGDIYSISEATEGYLDQLQEPLLIRGYFSAQTHPLLAPLAPQLKDLLREYEVAGDGRVKVEFIDPLQDPELEREAGEKFGVRPVAFQTADKYQSAVVNSYFDVVIQYGDQFEKLGFQDLIEVKVRNESDLDVRLRNPEYDLTQAIRKVLYGYRSGGNLFAQIQGPVTLKGFVSPAERLPEPLPELSGALDEVAAELKAESDGKLQLDIRDPDAGDGALADQILEEYGFRPLALGLLDPASFYFYLVLEADGHSVTVPLPEELNAEGLRRNLRSALQRLGPGLLRTIALYTPQGQGFRQTSDYSWLEDTLSENATLRKTDLADGTAPEDADLLLVVDPRNLDEKALFAMDQFLMQGGSVAIAASSYQVNLGGGQVSASEVPTGLEDWLEHHGIELKKELVFDPQNTPFPIPVMRRVSGFMVQEVHSLPYPLFPDVREDGLNQDHGITANLDQVTFTWASPLAVEDRPERNLTRLVESSPESWTAPGPEIQPDMQRYPEHGFPAGEERGRELLAGVVQGRFESYFKGRPSPLLEDPEEAPDQDETAEADAADGDEDVAPVISSVVETSPASARLMLFGSASFVSDTALDLAAEATRTRYVKPVELVQNAVDWTLEDKGLLQLRGRGQYSRTLNPLGREAQVFWEYLNYALAALGLVLVYGLRRAAVKRRREYYALVMKGGQA